MRHKAFTLMEFTIVVVVTGIIVAAAVTGTDNGAKEGARLAGEAFEADVAFARSKSIAEPDDPVVVKVDASTNRYWLAKKSAPDTPITHPTTGKPYTVQFGVTGKSGFERVQITGYDLGGDEVLIFDSTGSVDQSTPAMLQFSAVDAQYEVSVAPASAQTDTSSVFTKDLSGTTKKVILEVPLQ